MQNTVDAGASQVRFPDPDPLVSVKVCQNQCLDRSVNVAGAIAQHAPVMMQCHVPEPKTVEVPQEQNQATDFDVAVGMQEAGSHEHDDPESAENYRGTPGAAQR